MIELFIRSVIAFCYLAYVSVQAKHALHMFQQNRYELQRYIPWLKTQFLQDRKSIYNAVIKEFLLLGLLIFSLVWHLHTWILYVLYGIVFLTMFGLSVWQERQERYIKPLHYTSRVIRQIIVMIILNVIYAGFVLSLPIRIWGLFFIFGNFMQWLLIILMHEITMPVETIVKQHYLNDAKRILAQRSELKIVGITGSFGKTSSKHILQEIISEEYYSLMTPASFNTPMGITITIREHLKPIHEVFICEMGADKVGEIDFLTKFVKPQFGVLTSIGPQHLQTFGSIENIISEKFKIIENLPHDGVGFLNYDNEYIRSYQIANPCKIITFAIDHEDADFRAVNIVYSPNGSSFDVILPNKEMISFQTRLLGKHNIMNILAAIAVGSYLGIELSHLQQAVQRVQYVEHRLEVKTEKGVTWIDNAFNSNPVGAQMSLEVMSRMPGRRYIITPGLIDLGEKQEEYNEAFGSQMLGTVDEVYLVGIQQTKPIVEGLQKSGFDMQNVHVFATIHEAYHQVRSRAQAGDTILLENDLPDAFNK